MAEETVKTEIKAWFDGLEPELIGHVQNRGLDKKSADEAARQLVKDHREAQHKLGIPPDQVLRLPKEPGDSAWKEIYERLGAPKDASGYTFEGVKFKDGTPAPAELIDMLRAAAVELHLPVLAATEIAKRFISFTEQDEAKGTEERAAALGAMQTALRQNWGLNYDLNMFKITKASEALGWTKEVIDGMQTTVGGDKLLNALLMLANKMGEATWLGGGGLSSGSTALTREQAIERKATVMADRAWSAKFLEGDTEAITEMNNLNRIIVGGPIVR